MSLGNVSLAEARHLLGRELAKFDDAVALQRGTASPTALAAPRLLTPSKAQVERAVRTVFASRVDRVSTVNRSHGQSRETAQDRTVQLDLKITHLREVLRNHSEEPDQNTLWMMEAVCADWSFTIKEDSDLWWHLFDVVVRAQIEAAQRQLQRLRGMPSQAEDQLFSDQRIALDQETKDTPEEAPSKFVSIRSLFEAYVAGRDPAPATVKSFRPKVEAFRDFLGHDNAAAVTRQDMLRWRAHLLASGGRSGRPISVKTVKDTYLAAVSTVFQWGEYLGTLPSNEARGLPVRGPKTEGVRKGFRDEEAELILRSALKLPAGRLSPERAFAIRWVPWIAVSGVTIGERSAS